MKLKARIDEITDMLMLIRYYGCKVMDEANLIEQVSRSISRRYLSR